MSEDEHFNGWKDIAAYFGRSVRSMQRWERELALPIRRIKTSDGHTVYAVRSELDAWRRSRDIAIGEPAQKADEPLAAAHAASSPPAGAIVAAISAEARVHESVAAPPGGSRLTLSVVLIAGALLASGFAAGRCSFNTLRAATSAVIGSK